MSHEIEDEEVHFEDFVASLRRLVDRFEQNWLEHQEVDPSNWPDTMPGRADWFEQFIAFEESIESV